MRHQLIIAVDDYENAISMRKGLAECAEITVLELPPEKLPALAALDAVFLPLPAAERWGADPSEAAASRRRAPAWCRAL